MRELFHKTGNFLRKLFLKCKRFILFALVGGINTAVDYGVFTLISLLHAPAWLGQAAGYTAGTVCSFLLNRKITFRDGEGKILRQALVFVLVNLASLGVSSALMALLTNAFSLNRYIAKIFVTVLTMLMNYFGYKLLVFKIKEKREDKQDE